MVHRQLCYLVSPSRPVLSSWDHCRCRWSVQQCSTERDNEIYEEKCQERNVAELSPLRFEEGRWSAWCDPTLSGYKKDEIYHENVLQIFFHSINSHLLVVVKLRTSLAPRDFRWRLFAVQFSLSGQSSSEDMCQPRWPSYRTWPDGCAFHL